jgi:hypothetical protein
MKKIMIGPLSARIFSARVKSPRTSWEAARNFVFS